MRSQITNPTLLILGILASFGLAFNMVTIPFYREEVLINQGTFAPVEWIILAGFLLVILFDLLSVAWALFQVASQRGSPSRDLGALIWGILCLILLMGQKVMIDEIARETRLGWETIGEWIILYLAFLNQLLYSGFMVFHISRSNRAARLPVPPTAEATS
ncbi:MAG: hypothetical protein JSW54_04325 [Fidelibacterota bacterium]|nr:MAG: hypothetical protein JSW54_04325 [Candidatus Neomarinimicrobiota bacterium]